jgi:hypothetical protein
LPDRFRERLLAPAVRISHTSKEGSVAALAFEKPPVFTFVTRVKLGAAAAQQHLCVGLIGEREIVVADIARPECFPAQEAMLTGKTTAPIG